MRWFETIQREKGDSLAEGYVSELYEGRQAPISGSRIVLEYCLWLFHIREG
ncbi:hypothetical protein Goari_020603 [Gossypium aridum]|uniref:Uncharacterized protein n=1 Tax=Gossypium aridum TaxID=34290 RepID=A0A7J8YTI0_GOSAI|nr:hypothetical protein [Gossypium aridum]